MNDNYLMAELLFGKMELTKALLEKKYPPRDKNLVVTRFAPSPTGFLHIGGVYTALINERFAHEQNGIFMLRLEDTDKKREVLGSKKIICDVLDRFGIKIDEGVVSEDRQVGKYGSYIQSERMGIYHAMAFDLVVRGLAYPCFCSVEELEEIRNEQLEKSVTTGYYGKYAKYRNITLQEATSLLKEKGSFVLRFRVPDDAEARIEILDLIKGNLEMENNFNDFVLLKEDGLPTYHFAHACDDHLMRTTHVIRADEWMASLPIHIQLFKALEFEPPMYAHVAPIMKLDGDSKRKLSKRKDPESKAEFYIEKGYPLQALFIYLYTLINSNFEEWYLENKTKSLLDFKITLEHASKSGALYDLVKLNSIASEIIYATPLEENIKNMLEWASLYDEKLASHIDYDFVKRIFSTQGENSLEHRKDFNCYSDFAHLFGFAIDEYFKEKESPDLSENIKPEDQSVVLESLLNFFTNPGELTLKDIAKELGYVDKKKFEKDPTLYRGVTFQFYKAVRIILTKDEHGISLDDVFMILGNNEIIRRIKSYEVKRK